MSCLILLVSVLHEKVILLVYLFFQLHMREPRSAELLHLILALVYFRVYLFLLEPE